MLCVDGNGEINLSIDFSKKSPPCLHYTDALHFKVGCSIILFRSSKFPFNLSSLGPKPPERLGITKYASHELQMIY